MSPPTPSSPEAHREIALVELVDRLIDRGVVLAGDVTLTVAGVDLVHLSLRVLLASPDRIRDIELGR